MADRREYPRIATALEARYRAGGAVLERPATLTALSASGASFVAEEPLEPGGSLDHLSFTLGDGPVSLSFRPAAGVVSCEGRPGIGRPDEYLIGVKFAGLSAADAQRITDYVIERLAHDDPVFNPRIDLEKPVAVRFERFDEFVDEVSKNLSRTGMFIRCDEPRPVGAAFDFVLQLGDDLSLVQGRAEVVWRRRRREGADCPRGMGIRFLELDRASENVLHRLIERHIEPSYPRALGSTPDPASTDGELPEPPEGELKGLESE